VHRNFRGEMMLKGKGVSAEEAGTPYFYPLPE
jgi:hypothetical protein